MTIINISPNKLIQIGYEGEDKVTILRFGYSEKWLENGEGIFTVRVLRNGENQAYNAQLIKDDRENCTIDMTVTDVELSKKGYGEMQLVYTGADFVKKSPVYKYYVSRSVDDTVDPPAQDVYTQIIESLSDLQTDVQGLSDAVEDIGDISLLTTTAKTDLVSAINEVNEHGGGGSVTVDDALSATSENPVQNKVIATRINSLDSDVGALRTSVQSKADIQTVSALSDAVNGLDGDIQGLQTTVQAKADTATVAALSGTVSSLQTTVQSKADTSTVTALSETVSGLQTAVQSKADAQTVTALSGTVTGLQTSKADKTYVDTQLAEKASAQTVSDLSDDVSDLQTGLASKVGDVWIDGTSVIVDGVAKITTGNGVTKTGNQIKANTASEYGIKGGTSSATLLNPARQHYSAFYGLAKAAGHDEKNSTLPVGQYSEEAKVAIQKMLGIYEAPWELIREDTFTNEEEADHIIATDANGDAFELTDAILLFETPKQEGEVRCSGVVRNYFYGVNNYIATEAYLYTQSSNDATGFVSAFEQKQKMLHVWSIVRATISNNGGYASRYGVNFGMPLGRGDRVSYALLNEPIYCYKISIMQVIGTGHYRLYGKRKWQ